MKEVLFALVIVSLVSISVLIALYLFLKNVNDENKSGKSIIDYFEPDDSYDELSDMIDFFKTTTANFKYIIKG